MDGWTVNLPLGMAHFQGKVLFFSRVYTQENHRNVSLFRKRSWCTINNSPLIHWNPRTKKSLRFSGEKMSIFRDPGAICWVDLRTNLPQSVADVMRAIFRMTSATDWGRFVRMSCVQFFAASMTKDHPLRRFWLPLGPRMFFLVVAEMCLLLNLI